MPPSRISVIPNAILPTPGRSLRGELRHLIGHETGPIVGVVALLRTEKGITYLLRAATRIIPAIPHAHFVAIGDGPLRPDLLRLTHQLGITANVHFLGQRLDAPALIAGFDVLAVPSIPRSGGEGTPLVVIEQIEHERQGLLVSPGNAEELARAILRLLQHGQWARQLGEAGRRRVGERFKLDDMVNRTESIYAAALNGSVRPTILPRRVAPGFPQAPHGLLKISPGLYEHRPPDSVRSTQSKR